MFYINLPRNRVPLHIVEDCIFTRLQYLQLLHENDTNNFNGKFEYLFEDSVYDNVGHFTLRLIASTSQELWSYWLSREKLLFTQRLNHLSLRETHGLFRKILRRVKKHDPDTDTHVLTSLETFSSYFLTPKVFKHIVEKEHSAECHLYSCKISFLSVPDLIRRREIDVHNGQAIVYCSTWKTALKSLFTALIEHEHNVYEAGMREIVEMDPRLRLLCRKIRAKVFDEESTRSTINCQNIDEESKKFPLCMQHLHGVLRDRHRLSHYARFYYSLFLKECGMELQEAIKYWKDEYSKPHTCISGCTHDWQTSEKKFVYSIRHMYGLEGGRKNYKAPHCQMMHSELPGTRYEGGCPFKNFDSAFLLQRLDSWSIDDSKKQQICELGKDQPEVACGLFSNLVFKTDSNISIRTPVQYYKNTVNHAKNK